MQARVFMVLGLLGGVTASAADWVRAGLNTNQPVWGIRGGLLWATAPGGFRPGEPRGLIRLGYPVLVGSHYDLINFIAIEPIVRSRRGFSELEPSPMDGLPGKRIWADTGTNEVTSSFWPGQLHRNPDGTEELEVSLRVERFDNGAQVRVLARQHSNRPDELELSVFAEPDSEPLDYCILTATMGNMARTRLLWLKNKVVSSLELYSAYKETGFAPHREFSLAQLHRTVAGDLQVAVTTDEDNPSAVYPFAHSESWHYAGDKVTQFWRVASNQLGDDLRVVVNGRYTYWRSQQPVPGGVAFENFELREKFRQGQKFSFGITRATPRDLGFGAENATSY